MKQPSAAVKNSQIFDKTFSSISSFLIIDHFSVKIWENCHGLKKHEPRLQWLYDRKLLI